MVTAEEIGEETEEKLSEAHLIIPRRMSFNLSGIIIKPNLHPPAPIHFEIPEDTIVLLGRYLEIETWLPLKLMNP